MHEQYAEILIYIQGAARYIWIAMLVAWVFCIAAWAGVSQFPDRYEASVRVHVDTESMLQLLLRGLTIGSQVTRQLELLKKEIFSRTNLMEIARTTDLDLQAKDTKQMDKIIEELEDSISLSASGQDLLFTITATNSNPKLAKRIVEALLALFVEKAKGKNRGDSNSAQRFIEDQVKEYEVRLQQAELAKVKEVTGLPTLGQVSMNWIPEIRQQKWIGFVRFCGAGIMLFLVFMSVLLLEINGLNLSKI